MFMLMCCVHKHFCFCNVHANVLCSQTCVVFTDIFVMFMLMCCVHRYFVMFMLMCCVYRHFCNVHANVLCSQTFL